MFSAILLVTGVFGSTKLDRLERLLDELEDDLEMEMMQHHAREVTDEWTQQAGFFTCGDYENRSHYSGQTLDSCKQKAIDEGRGQIYLPTYASPWNSPNNCWTCPFPSGSETREHSQQYTVFTLVTEAPTNAPTPEPTAEPTFFTPACVPEMRILTLDFTPTGGQTAEWHRDLWHERCSSLSVEMCESSTEFPNGSGGTPGNTRCEAACVPTPRILTLDFTPNDGQTPEWHRDLWHERCSTLSTRDNCESSTEWPNGSGGRCQAHPAFGGVGEGRSVRSVDMDKIERILARLDDYSLRH